MSTLRYPLVMCCCRLMPAAFLHQSAVTHKFDKYNFGKKASRKFKNSVDKTNNRGPDFFHLDPLRGSDVPRVEPSVRQKTLGNALQDAVNAILASTDVPSELQHQSVEVTEISVSRNSSVALVYWKVENEEKEEIVEKLLKESTDQIRMNLPTYHHLTHTPTIHFAKDRKDSYLRRLDSLLNSCSQQDGEK